MEKLGLNVKGLKADLRKRLLEHYGLDFAYDRVDADDGSSSVGSLVGDAVGDGRIITPLLVE